jgi:hypothetical protein
MAMSGLAYLFGVGVVVVAVVVTFVVTGGKPWTVIDGADGRPSTSKFQWTIWTAIVLFAYSAIYFARARNGSWEALPDVPPNILIVLGFSTTTMVVAKGITTQFVANGRVVKPAGTQGGLLTDDGGQSDLSKVQLVMWTLLAIGIYLATVVKQVSAVAAGSSVQGSNAGLPDIDASLMVLMGLAQGGYLGKKLVTATQPAPTSVSPPRAAAGQVITVAGSGFGALQGTSSLTLNDNPVNVSAWSDTKIVFALPRQLPDGTAVVAGITLQIGLLINGQPAGQLLTLPIANPANVTGVSPASAAVGASVNVLGSGFDNQQTDSGVTFDGIQVPVVSWTDAEITVVVPAQLLDGSPMSSGRKVTVGVDVHGQPGSATWPFAII